MARHKNIAWGLNEADKNNAVTYDTIKIAVMMDIRDELQKLNRLLECSNVSSMPRTLKRIDRRLAKRIKIT